MKYLGQWVENNYNGFHWDNGNYMLCPADTGDKQMSCLHYVPADTVGWQCIHCAGDHCRRTARVWWPDCGYEQEE